jgi:hypothetical protein
VGGVPAWVKNKKKLVSSILRVPATAIASQTSSFKLGEARLSISIQIEMGEVCSWKGSDMF